jgi:predicted ATPase
MSVYLRDFRFRSIKQEEKLLDQEKRTCFNSGWPFGLFPRKGLERMEFESVTILHGGNGSGKSTALNIMAARLGVLRELPFTSHFFEWYVNGVEKVAGALEYNSELPPELRPVPEGSRFLASEDVFDRTLAVRGRNREIGRERTAVGADWLDANYGKSMRLGTIHGEEFDRFRRQNALRRKSMSQVIREEVGFDVRTGSNGENAFGYFQEKVRGGALYLLDEPENSLSAKWQAKLAVYLEGMARFEGCQFVIATHSPFLLGIRGAKIYDLDSDGVPVRRWTELENVREFFGFFRERAGEFEAAQAPQ